MALPQDNNKLQTAFGLEFTHGPRNKNDSAARSATLGTTYKLLKALLPMSPNTHQSIYWSFPGVLSLLSVETAFIGELFLFF